MSDPRYDPRFQRDWDGTHPPPESESESASASAAPPPMPPVRAAPAMPASTGGEGDVESPRLAGSGERTVLRADDDGGVAEDRPRRNPYRIALVVLGLALLAAGGGLLWYASRPTPDLSDGTDFVVPQLLVVLAPWVVFAGLTAIIIAIAVGAVRRR